jgi:transaldolase
VGEAVERGLRRFADAGGDPDSVAPVCTLMVGRLDDWVKVLVERDAIARARAPLVGPVNPGWGA